MCETSITRRFETAVYDMYIYIYLCISAFH